MAVEKMKELYPVGMIVQDFIIRNRDNPYGRSLWKKGRKSGIIAGLKWIMSLRLGKERHGQQSMPGSLSERSLMIRQVRSCVGETEFLLIAIIPMIFWQEYRHRWYFVL